MSCSALGLMLVLRVLFVSGQSRWSSAHATFYDSSNAGNREGLREWEELPVVYVWFGSVLRYRGLVLMI